MANNSKKLVIGKGLKGDGLSRMNGKQTKPYEAWKSILRRCYDPKFHVRQPTYIGCSVCDEWLYFPTFKTWFDENYVDGYQLDKDLLVDGNKEYGPDTCIFVPSQINSLFSDCGRRRGEYPIGVCYRKKTDKFEAYVMIDGKKKHLGCFDDANEAHKAYIKAKKVNVLRMAEKCKNEIPTKLYDVLLKKANEL